MTLAIHHSPPKAQDHISIASHDLPHDRSRPPHPLRRGPSSRRLRRGLERNARPKPQLAASRTLPQWADDVHERGLRPMHPVLYVAVISDGTERAAGNGVRHAVWKSVLGHCV